MVKSEPLDFVPSVIQESDEQDKKIIELVETQIRDIIHQRLYAVSGDGYWDSSIPLKFKVKVQKRISNKLDKHPYLTRALV